MWEGWWERGGKQMKELKRGPRVKLGLSSVYILAKC